MIVLLGGRQWLETYPGYRPRWVPVRDMPDLLMILCDGCNYVVSEDEYVECPECGVSMCLYCYQSGEAEHKRRFSFESVAQQVKQQDLTIWECDN